MVERLRKLLIWRKFELGIEDRCLAPSGASRKPERGLVSVDSLTWLAENKAKGQIEFYGSEND